MSLQLPANGILSEGKTVFAVFLFALIVRLVFISTLQDGYYFSDSARYETATRHIIEEGYYPVKFNRAPLYPAFLAGIYVSVGEEIIKTRIIQSLMSAAVAALLVLIGFRTGGYWVGVFAGTLWSIYPMGVFVAGTIYPTTLLAFLLALGVFCLLPGNGKRAGLIAVAISGALFGLAALAKPIVVAAILFVTAWLFVFQTEKRILSSGLFILAAVLALTPWTVRNYEIFGRFVPIEARSLDRVVPWTKTKEQLIHEKLMKHALMDAVQKELATGGDPQVEETHRAISKRLQNPPATRPESEVTSTPSAGPAEELPAPKVQTKDLPEIVKSMLVRFPKEFVSFFELYPRRVGFLQQGQRDKARAWKNPRLVENIPFGTKLVNAISAFAVSFLYLFALLGIRAMWLVPGARASLTLYLGMVLSFAGAYALSWGKIRYRIPVDPYIILLSAWGLFWAWGAVFGAQDSPAGTAATRGRNMEQATAN